MNRIRPIEDLILLDFVPTLQELPAIINGTYRRSAGQDDRPPATVEQTGRPSPLLLPHPF